MKRLSLFLGLLSLFSGMAQVDLSGKSAFTLTSAKGEKVQGTIFVAERGKGELPLECKRDKNALTLSNKDFIWQAKIEKLHRLDKISGVIRNISKRQLLLEPGVKLSSPRKNGDFYWGGFDVFNAGKENIKRHGFKGRTSKHVEGGLCTPFPVSTIISKDQAFILGGRLYELTSYTASEYQPAKNGKSAEITFSQRIVLEPGEELTLTFFCGSVPVKFDREQNVVEAFYESAPEDFRPVVGKDNPYIRGIHSQYTAWANRPDYEQERRRYATLDWTYTPFKRNGDVFGRKEFWDYKPLYRPFAVTFCQYAVGENFDYRKLTLEEFHKKRKSIFDRFGRKFGFSFYMCSGWCEKQLAEKYYSDSLADDKSATLYLPSWSTGHDSELRMFPIGNKFGDAVIKDIHDVVDELNIPGFAFDCGTPGVNHYGPAAKNPKLKGRSWDDKGIFCDELTALNILFDYVHAMRPDDPLYVWKNGEGKADMRMIETDLFGPVFSSWMPLTRYNAGQRPCVLHVREGYLFGTTIPDWRQLSRAEFMSRWQLLAAHLTFSDFEYGMSNSFYGYGGNLQSQYALPELLECINLGWRALIPVEIPEKGKKMLYRGRYGRKENTIFFYGNPYENPWKLTFIIDNWGLGGGYQLFLPKMRDNAAMNNAIANGNTTIKYTLPSRVPTLFEAAFSFDKLPADGKLDAEVSAEKDIHFMRYQAKLSNKKAFNTAVTPRENDDFTVKLFVNGKETAIGKETTIPANAVITAEYRSTRFVNPAAEIVSFPYTDKNNKPSFAVALPNDANEDEKTIAAYIADYFRFTDKFKITNGKTLLKAAPGVPQIKVSIRKGNVLMIKRDGNTITLSAPDFRSAWQAYIALARVMDKRYPYFFPLSTHFKTPTAIAKKFGIETLRLPYKRCFETNEVK
ncbi:MAG: hypothetical protein J6W00_10365 [Lentisphaeria bacterium]|nr:hypothetical protein [Lentisphaeria bacterium]